VPLVHCCCSFFATGSRDNTVKLWALSAVGTQQQQRPIATLPPFPAGITAVALSPCHVSAAAAAAAGGDAAQQDSAAAAVSAAVEQVHLLAVGMEDGCVQVWRLRMQGMAAVPAAGGEAGGQGVPQVVCERLWGSEVWQQHAAAVRRLRWAPVCVSWLCDGGDGSIALASCGEDNSVRVFDVRL
jgi:WD40 repeat protein